MALELERPEWHARAACRGHLDLYFPEDADGLPCRNTREEMQIITAICDLCPVQDPCMRTGMKEEWGGWGGWTEAEMGLHREPV